MDGAHRPHGFSLAAGPKGAIWAWGADGDGQLGDGSYRDVLEPKHTTRLAHVTSVAAGGNTAMAVAPVQSLSAPPGVLTYEGNYTDVEAPSSNQLVVYLPANAAAGELALADIYTACGERAHPAPGWTTVGHVDDTAGGNCGAEWIYDMVIPKDEQRPQDFSLPDGKAYGGAIVDFYGADAAQPIEAFAGSAQPMSYTVYDTMQVFEVTPPAVDATVPFSATLAFDTNESNDPIGSAGDQILQYDPGNTAADASVDGTIVDSAGTSAGITDYSPVYQTQEMPRVLTIQLLLRPAPSLAVP